MDTQENPELLMALYQEGDQAAATALIRSISPKLYRLFAAQTISRGDADDLLQETWLRIHKVRHTYRPGEPALAWFYAIARHVRVDHYRKAMRTTIRERELEETEGPATAGRNDEIIGSVGDRRCPANGGAIIGAGHGVVMDDDGGRGRRYADEHGAGENESGDLNKVTHYDFRVCWFNIGVLEARWVSMAR